MRIIKFFFVFIGFALVAIGCALPPYSDFGRDGTRCWEEQEK